MKSKTVEIISRRVRRALKNPNRIKRYFKRKNGSVVGKRTAASACPMWAFIHDEVLKDEEERKKVKVRVNGAHIALVEVGTECDYPGCQGHEAAVEQWDTERYVNMPKWGTIFVGNVDSRRRAEVTGDEALSDLEAALRKQGT